MAWLVKSSLHALKVDKAANLVTRVTNKALEQLRSDAPSYQLAKLAGLVDNARVSDITAGQLAEELEAQADLKMLDRVATWKEFSRMIEGEHGERGGQGLEQSVRYPDVGNRKDMNDKTELLTYKQVFLRSRSLEIIIEGILSDPPEDEALNPDAKPSWFPQAIELLNQCLLGDTSLHASLLDILFSVIKEFSPDSKLRGEMIRKVVNTVITSFKKDWRIEGQLLRLRQLQDKIHAKDDELSRLLEDPKGDPAVQLQERSAACMALFALSQKLRSTVDSVYKETKAEIAGVSREQQLKTFAAEIDGILAALQKEKVETEAKKEAVGKQHAEALAFQTTKANDFEHTRLIVTAEVLQLQARKKQLEAELAEVNQHLGTLKIRQKRVEEDERMFADTYSGMLGTMLMDQEQLASTIDDLSRDTTNARAVQKLLVDYQAILGGLQEKEVQAVGEQQVEAYVQWVASTERSLLSYKQHFALLRRVLHFCSEELALKEKKRMQMEELGMAAMLDEVMAGTDKLRSKQREGMVAFRRISREADSCIAEYRSLLTCTDDRIRADNRFTQLTDKVDQVVSHIDELRHEIAAIVPADELSSIPDTPKSSPGLTPRMPSFADALSPLTSPRTPSMHGRERAVSAISSDSDPSPPSPTVLSAPPSTNTPPTASPLAAPSAPTLTPPSAPGASSGPLVLTGGTLAGEKRPSMGSSGGGGVEGGEGEGEAKARRDKRVREELLAKLKAEQEDKKREREREAGRVSAGMDGTAAGEATEKSAPVAVAAGAGESSSSRGTDSGGAAGAAGEGWEE